MVPNAPCGVERDLLRIFARLHELEVPNAPCGVERRLFLLMQICILVLFLMHRVELKVG